MAKATDKAAKTNSAKTKGARKSNGSAATITDHEMQQVARANQTKQQPVIFIHGLWLLPSSWERWQSCSRTKASSH